MDTNPMPISMFDLNPAVRLMNAAWFIYGCMERETMLTMRALTDPTLRWTPPPPTMRALTDPTMRRAPTPT